MRPLSLLLPALGLCGLLPAPAHAAPATLEPADHSAIAASLRLQGIAMGDLAAVDRDAEGAPLISGALRDPLTAPELGGRLATSIAMDAASTDARWDGVLGVAGEVWQVPADQWAVPSSCEAASRGPLSTQHVAAAEARGERWSKRERNDIAQRLHPDLDRVLGALADDLTLANCAVEVAFAAIPPDSRPALLDEAQRWLGEVAFDRGQASELLAAWEQVDRGVLLGASRGWLAAIDRAGRALAGLDASAWPSAPLIWTLDAGEVWIGSMGSNAGAGNPVLLIDPGGDDHWRIRSDQRQASDGALVPVRGWIDLGGDDVWRSGALGAGSGAFGLGVGLDLAGDDVHEGGAFSVGAGVFGVGAWLDVAGRDRYDVLAGGQGFGLAGLGVLRDSRRDDVYRADRWAQGAALPGGVGVLHDGSGGDRYLLTDDLREERAVAAWEEPAALLPSCHAGCGQGVGVGLRGLAPGGAGLLVDDGGDDLYSGVERVQGAATHGGLGVVRDGGGDDRWLANTQSQAASSGGLALLMDMSGADEFSAHVDAQGWADQAGVAWLIDAGGVDRYQVDHRGQGWAEERAAAFALDRDGGAFSMSRDRLAPRRFPGIGAQVGGLRDVRAMIGTGPGPALRGSVAELKGAIEGLEPNSERALLAIGARLRGVPDPAPAEREQLVSLVLSSARAASSSASVRHHLGWVTELTERAPMLAGAIEELSAELAGSPHWRVREAAWNARWRLSQVRDLTLSPEQALSIATGAAVALQKETHPDVRAAAARVAGAFGGAEVAGSLVTALLTEHVALRRSAERALLQVAGRTDGVGVARGLYGVAAGEQAADVVVREAALRVLGASRQRDAVDVMAGALTSGDEAVQRAAAEGLGRHGSRQAKAALGPWLESRPELVGWIERLAQP